jgi:DNA recombination protein RmuC
MSALQLTPAEWLLAGLLVAVLLLQAWLLLRGGAAERRLREGLGDDLGDLMEQRLAARHRELLLDLHDGLGRQTDRIGEHARADRELLQRGLTAASLQLSRGMQALTQSVDGRLDTLSGQVNQRLDEGFRKTNETFASVMARLATIDEAQKKIDGLTTNVVSLQELLGDKRARGAFGEVQLENLVRNMLPPEAFAFQQVLPNGTRVDCLLTLPAPTGNVAVDAKFPLENYHRMFDDTLAELDRRAAQQAFRADVKRHVDAISTKYILPGSTADGAVMFLPAEAVFAELHAYHPEVVAYAQHKRVWIVSPTTLMAVLNTARAVMKDVETRKQIHVIQDALGKLAKDFQRFDERMAALARHIEQASRDVQDVHTSSRKISAHFRRIESVQLDEEDEGGGAGAPAALTGGAPEGGGAGGGEGWNSATVGNPSVAAAVEARVTGGRE